MLVVIEEYLIELPDSLHVIWVEKCTAMRLFQGRGLSVKTLAWRVRLNYDDVLFEFFLF
jgi:hypothetical protein